MKLLNKKLGTLDGIIPEQDEDDIIKIMSGRLTADEYMKASQGKRDEDDNKGDYEFTEENKVQLEEDLWYILNEKLEGIEARGKLKGIMDGDGIMAWQKVHKWYSAVTGATLSSKMSQAMNPDPPRK